MFTPRGKLIIPQKYLPYLGAGAAAVVTFAYILWGPDVDRRSSNSRSGSKRKVAGLENLGNTCYLNTILQSLAACPVFIMWLSRSLRRRIFKGKHNELAYKLSKTLEVVNDYSSSHGGSQVYSPHEVLHALYSCSWRADRGQQDAHELFQFLLSVLVEDMDPIPSPMPLCDTSRFTESGRNGFTSTHTDLHSNIEADLPKVASRDGESPFRGLLANHLTCTVCGHKNPVTYSSFDCLTLPIPASVFGTLSLECILAKFTQSELVHDVECTQCAKKLYGKIDQPTTRNMKWFTPRTADPMDPRRVSTTVPTSTGLITSPVTPPIAPPTLRLAPPTNDQVCLISSSENRLTNEDLHMRTPPPEKLSSDSSSTGYDTGSSGLEVCGDVDNGLDLSTQVTEQNGIDLVSHHCNGNNRIINGTSFGSVCHTDGLMYNTANTDVYNETNTIEMTGSTERQNLSKDLTQRNQSVLALQDLNNPQQMVEETLKSDSVAISAEEESTQVITKHVQETATVNDLAEEWSERTTNQTLHLPSEARMEINLGCMVSSTKTNNSLPNDKHVNGNHQNKFEHSNQGMRHSFPKNKSKDADQILPERTSSQPVNNLTVNLPKCHSTPKHYPSPRTTASLSANQNYASGDTPAKSPSIFGKIPGTDGMTPPSSDTVANDYDNENLSPKCRRIFRKQLTLGKLPQCLCIHLQRVTWRSNGLPSRREEQIVFPEYLDMSLYKQPTSAVNNTTSQTVPSLLRLISEDETTPTETSLRKSSHHFIGGNFLSDHSSTSRVGIGSMQMPPRISHHAPGGAEEEDSNHGNTMREDCISDTSLRSAEARYRLASAVVHQGDAYSGHFLTFRRAPSVSTEPLSDNWLCVSDESVYTSTNQEVFSQKAYMLYYQRI